MGLPGVYKLGAWYATRRFCRPAFRLERRRCGGFARRSGGRRSAQSPRQLAASTASPIRWSGAARSQPQSVLARGASPSDRNLRVVLRRWRRRPERPAARPRRRHAHLRRRLRRDQPAMRSALDRDMAAAAPGFPIRDYEMRVRAELSRRRSRRGGSCSRTCNTSCIRAATCGTRTIRRPSSATPSSPACAARSNSEPARRVFRALWLIDP